MSLPTTSQITVAERSTSVSNTEGQNRINNSIQYKDQDAGILDDVSSASSYQLLENTRPTDNNINNKTISMSKNLTQDDEKLKQLLDQQSTCTTGACMPTELICQITQHEDVKVQSSNVTAFVTLLKALFGVSLLSSPRVLGETGLVLGTLVYGLILMACVGSCWCLLQARAKVASSKTILPPPSPSRSSSSSSSSSLSTTAWQDEPRPPINTTSNDTRTDDKIIISQRPSLLSSNHSTQSQDSKKSVNAITYGDLGRTLLGAKQSTMINFLIVSLHICFGAGLVATSMHQIAILLDWEDDYDTSASTSASDYSSEYNNNGSNDSNGETNTNQVEVYLGGRCILACVFFPVIAILLQFRNIKDLFWVCLAGIVVFVLGCVGTMLYSTTLVDNDGDGSVFWDIPQDAFVWKWSGIPNFVASTLCAMEGINLALPIANHYLANAPISSKNLYINNKPGVLGYHSQTLSPIPVVTSAVTCFGIFSLIVAYFGFLSGHGGGTTKNGNDDEDQVNCAFVAHCLDSDLLETIHRLSLTVALVLTLPIILYPSLELLERWADERYRQLKTGMTASNRSLGDSWTGFVWGTPSESQRKSLAVDEALFGREPYFPFLHRNWRYRISHAAAVCLLAIVDRQWERGLVLYKGIGLSIACFVLPVVLFVRAYTVPVVLQNPGLTAALTGLATLGLINFVLVILSVFTVHNFLPNEIHEGPMHDHHHDSGDHM